MGTVLIFGETEAGSLTAGFWEQVAVGRRLCEQTGWAMDVVVIGRDTGSAEQTARASGAARVLVVDDDRLGDPWPEATAEVLAGVCVDLEPGAIVMPRSTLGSEVSARLAFKLDTAMAMDVMSLQPDDQGLIVTRPVHGGAATATLRLSGRPWIIVPRKGAFTAAEPSASLSPEPTRLDLQLGERNFKTTIVSQEYERTAGQELERARVIVAGGRGMGGPEPFQLLMTVADSLGGALAASRPPCDSGWVEPMLQVGLTGKTVAPDLYVAVGISGATQHMTGCSLSRVIVAINNDPDAPIFRMASYGVVGDWQEVLVGFLEGLTGDSRPDQPKTGNGGIL